MAYEAGDFLVRAVMTNATGLPADEVINDFAFKGPLAGAGPDEAADAFTVVDHFYRTNTASGSAVGKYISQAISRSVTHRMEAYHIHAGPLGSPFATMDWLGPPAPAEAGNNLPNEVAAVLSFHGDLTGIPEEAGAGRPRAQRRGRIYLGPLIVGATNVTAANPHLDPLFQATTREAAVRLMDEASVLWGDGDEGMGWCVWSRVGATLHPVVGGWTDTAPDTQRRRGQAPTSRTVWG